MEIEEKITVEPVVSKNTDVRFKVQSTFYKEIKSIVKGMIVVKLDRDEESKTDILYVSIKNYGIKWSDRLRLFGDVVNGLSQDEDYLKTLVIQIYENYRKYIENKYFCHPV